MENDYDLINLSPDMAQSWGRVMHVLRTAGDKMLYSLCSSLDVAFDRENIIITAPDMATYTMLQKYKPRLDEIIGSDIIELYQPEQLKKQHHPVVPVLKELFADLLEIK